MVLRNKDGSIYKLKSPNALMKNQSIWTDYKLHNMNWTSTEHKDQTQISLLNILDLFEGKINQDLNHLGWMWIYLGVDCTDPSNSLYNLNKKHKDDEINEIPICVFDNNKKSKVKQKIVF